MQLPAIMEDKLGDVSDFMAAIERFTEAIQLNRSNYQLWSQRSAALARVGKYQECTGGRQTVPRAETRMAQSEYCRYVC